MKNTITFSAFFVASFLFFSLAFARQAKPKAAANDLISDLCSTTLNITSCLKTLRSEPTAAKANLTGLGHISIRLATKKAKENFKLIGTLMKTCTKSMMVVLSVCNEVYNDTIDSMKEAETSMKQHLYYDMRTAVSASFDDVETCADTFKEMSVPEPPLFQKGEQDLNDLLGIVIAVAARLDVN